MINLNLKNEDRVSNGPAFALSDFEYLLFIKARYNVKNIVISFLKRANPFHKACLFLQLCKK